MRVESLHINNIGGINDLSLSFNPRLNVICGPNGVGKTTVLRVIADAFSSNRGSLKRNAQSTAGQYGIEYRNVQDAKISRVVPVNAFDPLTTDKTRDYDDSSSYVLLFLGTRDIQYKRLESVPRDSESGKFKVMRAMSNGIEIDDMKGWFENRFLFGVHEGSLTNAQKANYNLAVRAFEVLEPTVKFKTVDSRSLDILVSTAHGDIYLEYLSSGYKSCLYILLGLIKEIEFRFEGRMAAEKFDGVVLIDEIDLHLHPTWQPRLVDTLVRLFPNVQFILSTHSPSVLQSLDREEIIPLACDEDGLIVVRDLKLTEYGLQGWSIEEILRYVMDMPETTSQRFEQVKLEFRHAMDAEDIEAIRRCYEILSKMLHPESVVKRLIDIQVAGLVDEQ